MRACVGLVLAAVLATYAVACKRKTPPVATAAWLGEKHACARIKGSGDIRCWGANDEGELALTPFARGGEVRVPAATGLPKDLRALALGDGFSCVLHAGGRVQCWGRNDAGKLDAGSDASKAEPVDVTTEITELRAASRHACALTTAGVLRCWGENDAHQVSAADPAPRVPRAVDIKLPGAVTAFALGARHTCAYVPDGRTLSCWGDSGNGRLGEGLDAVTKAGVRALAAGAAHTCALTDASRVYCWGANDVGQLGDGTRTESRKPVLVVGVDGAVSIGAGRHHTCALLRSGTVACWGGNEAHQLANGTAGARSEPVPLHGIVSVKQILLAGDSSCVLLADGQLRCWGRNHRGQLGDGSTTEHDVPMPVRFSLSAPRVVASAGRY